MLYLIIWLIKVYVTYLAMESIKLFNESLNLAATVGVLGFIVTKRPFALVRLLFSVPCLTSTNIPDKICKSNILSLAKESNCLYWSRNYIENFVKMKENIISFFAWKSD